MFDSGIGVTDLIAEIRKSADISVPVSEEFLLESYNRTEQLLYSEIIKEQASVSVIEATEGIFDIDLTSVSIPDCALPRYEDILSVYVGDRELTPTNLNSVGIMRNSFCKYNNGLRIHSDGGVVDIMFYVRPSLAKKAAVDIERTLHIIDFVKGYSDDDIAIFSTDSADACCHYVLTHKADISAFLTEGMVINSVKVTDGGLTYSLTEKDYPIMKAELESHKPDSFRLYNLGENKAFSFSYIHREYTGETEIDTFKSDIASESQLALHINCTETVTDNKTVKLPLEFVDMMRCKLKSDLYNAANDETNAAKWLDEYNNYLENFKAYLQARTSTWGR